LAVVPTARGRAQQEHSSAAALAADDECVGAAAAAEGEAGHCALSALQLRAAARRQDCDRLHDSVDKCNSTYADDMTGNCLCLKLLANDCVKPCGGEVVCHSAGDEGRAYVEQRLGAICRESTDCTAMKAKAATCKDAEDKCTCFKEAAAEKDAKLCGADTDALQKSINETCARG